MRDCETLRDQLKAYLDGELPVVSRLTIRWHLAHCPFCREEIKAMENIGNELRAGDVGGLEPALRAKILSGIPDSPPEQPDAAEKMSRRRKTPLLAFGAVASVVVLWFLFYPVVAQRKLADQVAGGSSAERSMAKLTQSPTASAPISDVASPSRPADGKVETDSVASGQPSPGLVLGQTLPAAKAAAPSGGTEAMKNEMMKRPIQLAQADKPVATYASPAAPSGGKDGRAYDAFKADFGKKLPPDSTAHKARPDADAVANMGIELPTERQVHREASITVEVDALEAKSDSVEEMVKTGGGYVANNQLTTEEDGTKTAELIVKIPVADFDSFLSRLAKLGNVKAKNVTGEDITEKISDEQQNERVLKEGVQETQAKLRQQLSRSQRKEDAETLRQLKIRAAQSKARLEMLKKFSALANVTIELREKPKNPPPAPQTGGFVDEMKDSASSAMHSFVQAARLPVLLLVWALVYSPVLLLLAVGYKYVRKLT